MNKSKIILNTEKFVKKALSGEGTGHDWWHIERVRNNARLINKTEKADWFVVELAVLLHDVGDRKVIGKYDDDYSIATNFMKKQKVPAEIIDKVIFIIKNMSFSETLNNRSSSFSKEFQVMQDADRLDAIGAIGIARAFTFGGNKSRPIYDPNEKALTIKNSDTYKKLHGSTLHHFDEKLFLLKNLMNTKTAKKIAGERHKYMKTFYKQFLAEWNGKK